MLRTDTINVMPLNNAAGAVVTLMDTSNVDTVFIAGKLMKRGGSLVGVDLGGRGREGAGGQLPCQLLYRVRDQGLVPVPGQTEQLDELAPDRNDPGLVDEQGDTGPDAADELRAVLDQVVVADAQIRPVTRLHVAHRVEGVGKVGQGVVDQVAREQDRTLAPLSDELKLVQSVLDSLSFAIIVARLEDSLGVDPFNATEAVEFPVTFGDFVRLYERFAK